MIEHYIVKLGGNFYGPFNGYRAAAQWCALNQAVAVIEIIELIPSSTCPEIDDE